MITLRDFVFLVPCDTLTDRDKVRAKIFAHLLSMPVQLKYLFVEKFEWLLYVIQYVSIHFVLTYFLRNIRVLIREFKLEIVSLNSKLIYFTFLLCAYLFTDKINSVLGRL
jgi:hypothetical protein